MEAKTVGVSTPYWADVNHTRAEVEAAVLKQAKQPKDGTCFIVSTKPRAGCSPEAKAGMVTLTTIKLAGQRLADQTHDLASDEQITACLAAQEAERKIISNELARSRGQLVFQQQPRPLDHSEAQK